jgi:hypothetical protein
MNQKQYSFWLFTNGRKKMKKIENSKRNPTENRFSLRSNYNPGGRPSEPLHRRENVPESGAAAHSRRGCSLTDK